MQQECWLWAGRTRPNGYGAIWIPETRTLQNAHRFVYEALVGEIPQKLVIDHLCRNKLCVNPNHLEPVTDRENILRGEGLAAKNAKRTHCNKGHKFTPENTRKRSDGGRRCLACARPYHREYEYNRRHEIKLNLGGV